MIQLLPQNSGSSTVVEAKITFRFYHLRQYCHLIIFHHSRKNLFFFEVFPSIGPSLTCRTRNQQLSSNNSTTFSSYHGKKMILRISSFSKLLYTLPIFYSSFISSSFPLSLVPSTSKYNFSNTTKKERKFEQGNQAQASVMRNQAHPRPPTCHLLPIKKNTTE